MHVLARSPVDRFSSQVDIIATQTVERAANRFVRLAIPQTEPL